MHTASREGHLPGGSLNTASMVSSETIIPRKVPTPALRNSRTQTPLLPDQAAILRPITPLLQLRPVIPPPVSPRHLAPPPNNAPEMSIWSELASRLIMDAEDKVLLFRGSKVPFTQTNMVRGEADEIAGALRDCFPHCNPLKQEITACRRGIAEVVVQLAFAAHEYESDSSSSRASECGGSSRCCTPLDHYLPHLPSLIKLVHQLGGARPRDCSGGCQQDVPVPPPACTGAGVNPTPIAAIRHLARIARMVVIARTEVGGGRMATATGMDTVTEATVVTVTTVSTVRALHHPPR